MRTTKFLLAAMFVAALMLMPTASALPTEASPGMHAAATTEDAMTYAAAETATLTTLMMPGATEVLPAGACEAGTAVALTTTFAAIALSLRTTPSVASSAPFFIKIVFIVALS